MLKGIVVPVLALMLSACGGNSNNSGSLKSTDEQSTSVDVGQQTYVKYCLACHQGNGSGVPGMYPPLINSERVTGDKDELIKIVLYGLKGPIVVDGQQYNQIMPKQDFLTDKEIASVLTHILKEMGKMKDDSITALEVKKLRGFAQ